VAGLTVKVVGARWASWLGGRQNLVGDGEAEEYARTVAMV
jgi:hypothetical protein